MATLTPSAPQSGLPVGKELDLAESAAGEEDPGSAVEVAAAARPGRSDQPARGGDAPSAAQAPMRPGDAAPEGTPACLATLGALSTNAGISMAHHYTAQILWQRDGNEFLGNRYSRRHLLRFDGGVEVVGSSSPQVVPLPHSDPAGVDPEEAFVASLSSCHMLWFLSLASRRGFRVDSYADNAEGVMARNAAGKMAMTQVTLRPEVVFSGTKQPTRGELDELHHQAHEECFIANSVTTEVRCEAVYPTQP